MEQGKPAAQILIDNGIGGAGNGFPAAQTPGKPPGKGGFSRAQVPQVGQHRAGPEQLCQFFPQGFRFLGGVCDELHMDTSQCSLAIFSFSA